jgi:hypothetical protein
MYTLQERLARARASGFGDYDFNSYLRGEADMAPKINPQQMAEYGPLDQQYGLDSYEDIMQTRSDAGSNNFGSGNPFPSMQALANSPPASPQPTWSVMNNIQNMASNPRPQPQQPRTGFRGDGGLGSRIQSRYQTNSPFLEGSQRPLPNAPKMRS